MHRGKIEVKCDSGFPDIPAGSCRFQKVLQSPKATFSVGDATPDRAIQGFT